MSLWVRCCIGCSSPAGSSRTDEHNSGHKGEPGLPWASVRQAAPQPIAAIAETLEHLVQRRVVNRPGLCIRLEVLLADIGDIAVLVVLGEKVIERLVTRGTDVLGDRLVPFLAVGEDRVDIEDDAA